MQFHHPLPFGAELQPDGTTRFRIWAPSAMSLSLERDGMPAVPMHGKDGWFAAQCEAPAGTRYRFVMPDGLRVPDPASRLQAADVHGPSVVVDPTAYVWKHPDWRGRPWHEAVIYELHPGILGGFAGVTAKLPELAALGITVVELMPLSDFPGQRNWGYDGVLPFAPDTSYGEPDELKALIDAAHGLGMMVLLDVVYNHFGPDGAYIHAYAREFFTEDVHTPWGAAIDYRRPEVHEYFTQNALFWLEEYRFDGLRMDAVHAIIEEQFLIDLAATTRAALPDRHIHLTIEHENNRAALLRPGRPHFDAQWTDDFHHAMHVLLTGETEGYYEDFEDAAPLMARMLAEGFAYQGEHSKHADRPRGEPSGDLPTSSFIVFLQNHDQTGNRAMGERLTTLITPEKLEAGLALLLLSPFIPLLFMGEEYGAKNPFLFFTAHGDELAQLVRDGRRAEFGRFAAFQDETRRKLIPDPNAASTFHASVPDRADDARFALVQRLIATRRERIVPGIEGARSEGAEATGPRAVVAHWSLGSGERLSIAADFSDDPAALTRAEGETLFQNRHIIIRLEA